jgi:N-acetylated-alpha-linked acidic dipeptidase
MRLAGADVLPLRYESYGRALREQLDNLRRDVVLMRRKAAIGGGNGEGESLDPDFGPVLAALDDLERAGEELDLAAEKVVVGADGAAANRVNTALIAVERALLSDDGLPDRPWFRNLIYAPGLTTGYAPWPFPELRQAVEDHDPELFERGRDRVVAALEEMARRLRAAAAAAEVA